MLEGEIQSHPATSAERHIRAIKSIKGQGTLFYGVVRRILHPGEIVNSVQITEVHFRGVKTDGFKGPEFVPSRNFTIPLSKVDQDLL